MDYEKELLTQGVPEGFQQGTGLLVVDHLAVHLHNGAGKICRITCLFDQRTVKFLRIAELGQNHKNPSCIGGPGVGNDLCNPVFLNIIQNAAVIQCTELGGKTIQRRAFGRCIGAVLATLGSNIVSDDLQTKLIQNRIQRRGIRQNAGGQNADLLLSGLCRLQLGDQRIDQSRVLLLQHEESALKDIAALCIGNLRMLCQHRSQAAHSSIVRIVHFQRCAKLVLVKL